MAEVYVSIGSNVEPERQVRSCLRALRERYGALRVSTIYRSKAVGFAGAGPDSLYMSKGGENMLGAEWVMPDG